MPLKLQSTAFDTGQSIPKKFTCDGENVSPALSWQDAPADTQSFALICEDPDAPSGTFSHWVLYDLAPDTDSLPEDYPPGERPSHGGLQGLNDFGDIAFGGPCPPPGSPHRYFFRLYALDSKVNLSPGATRDQVLDAIKSHTLEEAELMGTYQRS